MDQLPVRFQSYLIVARGLYLASGTMLMVRGYLGLKDKSYSLSDPAILSSTGLFVLGLALAINALFFMTARSRWLVKQPEEMTLFLLRSSVFTGVGFLLVAYLFTISWGW